IGEEDTGVEAESTDFIYSDKGEGTILVAYVGNDYDVVIPEKTTRIGNGAFADNKVINTVKIPQNVTSIGNSAFENCINLCTISLPNNLLSIGDSAFAGCTQLEGTSDKGFSELLALPESLILLGDSAFADCGSLYSVYIPFSLVTSGEWGESTFEHCTFLHSITWGNATEANKTGDIPSYTFYECSKLDVDAIPAYIQYISQYAFAKSGISGELSLTCILDRYAFAECKNITSVIITMYNSMSIRTGVFASCYNLERVEFVIPDVLTGGQYSSTNVVFQIGELAFSGCNKLDTIILPDNTSCTLLNEIMEVKWAILDSAFASTGFKNITLPSTISHIDYRAFADCSIESFTLEAEIPPYLAEAAFENTPLVYIYVPSSSVSTYKTATRWSTYDSIIQEIIP
ncbi:MAG: leucine-rich repeat domain-containing protein, partial [Roseburia sp.]